MSSALYKSTFYLLTYCTAGDQQCIAVVQWWPAGRGSAGARVQSGQVHGEGRQ